jgi:glycosyltransferase involved in cell wall biosynthesis
MNNPLVTVIITTYNRPNFLPIAIQSVIDQTYTNWELKIINDAGQDVKNIVDSFNDNRIKYINKEKNAGLGAARNTGLDNANGKYINFLDEDDQFYPFHIQTHVEAMEKNDWEICYTDCVCHVYENGEVKQRVIVYSFDYEPDMLLYQNIVPVLGVMYKLDDITKNVKLDENAKVYEDWELWLELTKYYDMHHLAVPTCMYTFRHDGSTMSSSRNEFTTMLPEIYSKTYLRAKNQPRVCMIMNQILQQRGLPQMFSVQTLDKIQHL